MSSNSKANTEAGIDAHTVSRIFQRFRKRLGHATRKRGEKLARERITLMRIERRAGEGEGSKGTLCVRERRLHCCFRSARRQTDGGAQDER
jgi:hypothetical protein